MARYTEGDRNLIDETADALRRDCFVDDGSVLFPGESVWTVENLAELQEKFVDNQVEDRRTFEQKLEQQLSDASSPSRQLFSELLLTYALFVSGLLRPRTKRELVALPLKFHDESLPTDSTALRALEQGIGNPGAGFSMRRPDELIFLIEMAVRIKSLDPEQREEILGDDPWMFARWLDREVPGSSSRQMRHLLPHLFYPDFYERVGSGDHKRQIARTFEGLIEDEREFENQDELLYEVRQRLEDLLRSKVEDVESLDYYRPPLERAWRGSGSEDLDTVEFKGQIVLYGPPGTGKTYAAKNIAEQLIRRAALRTFGAIKYFERQALIDSAIRDNVHRLQLHPGYSYEEFIRGLHLDEGSRTVYRPGFLAQLAHQMSGETQDRLPHVVILDEMNRADLSRVFGEAFSLLENRDEVIELPMSLATPQAGHQGTSELDAPTDRLELPKDLYFVGTMNLIDQSVEQVDFALRRRFLWKPMRFDNEALIEVLSERWERHVPQVPWDRVESEMIQLAENAQQLNETIRHTDQLGSQYEIGHTYFFDLVELTAKSFGRSFGRQQHTFLWKKQGNPRQPLDDLWRLSLQPLLEQYLAGLDASEQERLLSDFEKAFKQPPPHHG